MVTDEDGKAVFAILRPYCVRAMSSPSVESLTELQNCVRGLNAPLHPHLVDYVLLPARTAVKRFGSSNLQLLEASLNTMSEVFSHVKDIESWSLCQELFTFLCVLLDEKMAADAGYKIHTEDLVCVVVKTLRNLLLNISNSIREQLLSEVSAVGHCVSVLLHTLQSYQSKALRRETLSAMLAITAVDSQIPMKLLNFSQKTQNESVTSKTDADIGAKSNSPSANDRFSFTANLDPSTFLSTLIRTIGVSSCDSKISVFASFLPGMTIGLTKLVTTDTTIGSSVVTLSFLTWAHYVSLVLADSGAVDHTSGFTGEQEKHHELLVVRTKEWESDTDHKLSVLVQRMSVLVTSEEWRVRVVMVGWAHCLLMHCYRTLVTCTPSLLEVLVTLSHDSFPQVSSVAQLSLKQFSNQYSKEGNHHLTAVLEEKLHSLASSLPRLMRQQDDLRKIATLQLFTGYLRLLGSHVISLVHSHSHLTRIIQALLQTLTLELSSIRVLEQHPHSLEQNDDQKPSTSSCLMRTFPLTYAHFRSEHVERLLYEVCQLLGFYGSLTVLLDQLLDQYRMSSMHRSELLIIIGHVLLGGCGLGCVSSKEPSHAVSSMELFSLVDGLLQEVMTSSSMYETSELSRRDIWMDTDSPNKQESVMFQCLLLNVVSVCATVLSHDFDPLMQLVAYPLLQCLGHGDPSIVAVASETLWSMTTVVGYGSLQEVIRLNADYLVNSIAHNLRSPSTTAHYIQAVHVLQAVLKHGDKDVLPLIQDSVDELLLSLDIGQVDSGLIWPALQSLAESAEKWSTSDDTKSTNEHQNGSPLNSELTESLTAPNATSENDDGEHSEHVTPETIEQFFIEYHKHKDQEEYEREKEEEKTENVSQEEESYSSNKPLTPVEHCAVQVIQRCVHHMSATVPQVRLAVLDSLKHCLVALHNNQTLLLPEAHNVWSPFLPRLTDPFPHVARVAWEVLVVMSDVCGDFLRKRVIKTVWPPLIKSLESMAVHSHSADKLYTQRAIFKLQRQLLECVGVFSLKLKVPAIEVEKLAHACFPYLSCHQPDQLQEACVVCFKHLIKLDPDTMWLLLQQLVPVGVVATHPHRLLKPLHFPPCPQSVEYSHNAETLLLLTES